MSIKVSSNEYTKGNIDISFEIDNKNVNIFNMTKLSGFFGRIYWFFGQAVKTSTGEFIKKSVFFDKLADAKATKLTENVFDVSASDKLKPGFVKQLYAAKFSCKDCLTEEKCQYLWNQIEK